MTPPRLRLVGPPNPDPPPVPEDSSQPPPAPVPQDIQRSPPGRGDEPSPLQAGLRPAPVRDDLSVLQDSPPAAACDGLSVLGDSSQANARSAPPSPASPRPEPGVPWLTLVPSPSASRPASTPTPAPAPAPADATAALAELDALLALGDPLPDAACVRLAALALQVPGRQRLVTAALGRAATPVAVLALRELPPAVPGLLEALLRCFARGVSRGSADPSRPPVPEDMPPLLALDFRSSRARGFPDLVARAQAIAARSPAAEFAALDVDQRRHYRLTFFAGRSEPAALAAQLRAAHLDLAWLHGRLVRLRGSRLWLGGWRFDADDPLGPAAQAHLLQAWLRWAEQEPAA